MIMIRQNKIVCVILWTLAASMKLRAEIPMTSYWERIAELSKARLFVETYGSRGKLSKSADDFIRLSMLGQLFDQKNAPPDLASALRAALPTAEVSAMERLGLQVAAKDMPGSRKKVLAEKVSTSAFTGPVSELLAGLRLEGYSAILNQAFVAPAFSYPRPQKVDFKLEKFSFTGSFRELLVTLSAREGENGSYFVWIDESRCIVRFFPIGGTW
jgi:hypothetical protein